MSEYRLQYRGTLFPIRSGEVILGRSSYASIVVNNPLASREHAVVRAAAKDNYRFSSIVLGIVNTDAFRNQGAVK